MNPYPSGCSGRHLCTYADQTGGGASSVCVSSVCRTWFSLGHRACFGTSVRRMVLVHKVPLHATYIVVIRCLALDGPNLPFASSLRLIPEFGNDLARRSVLTHLIFSMARDPGFFVLILVTIDDAGPHTLSCHRLLLLSQNGFTSRKVSNRCGYILISDGSDRSLPDMNRYERVARRSVTRKDPICCTKPPHWTERDMR